MIVILSQIICLIAFSIVIGTCDGVKRKVNGIPVLINQYKYDIPVHHTPPQIKYDLPYPYHYPYPSEVPVQPHEIYGLPNVVEIVVPKVVPPKPREQYGVPEVKEVVENDVPENQEVVGEKAVKEPVETSYKFEIPATPEPESHADCDDDILIPAEPVSDDKSVITNYKFEIPAVVVPTKPGKPATVYGVPEVPAPKVVETPTPQAPGKPALVYGVPDNLPIIVIN